MKKIKTLNVSFKIFQEMIEEGSTHNYFVDCGIPKNSKIINMKMSYPETDGFEIVIESESFPEIKEGERVPYIIATFSKV